MAMDVFVRDLDTGIVVLVSANQAGSAGDNWSMEPAISSDGRYVAFSSLSSDLVAADSNGVYDIFVRDLIDETTILASPNSNGSSSRPSISGGGDVVAFESLASNLFVGDTNDKSDAFVFHRASGLVRVVSPGRSGGPANERSRRPALSSDGQVVAFESRATNLCSDVAWSPIGSFAMDLATGRVEDVSSTAGGRTVASSDSHISGDGAFVAFVSRDAYVVSGDGNSRDDVFLRDVSAGTTKRISMAAVGADTSGDSWLGRVSRDGRYVAFTSLANNLVAGDTNSNWDVFFADTTLGSLVRVNLAANGSQSPEPAYLPSISDDGRFVMFSSSAADIVAGDANGRRDVFRKDMISGAVVRGSLAFDGGEPNADTTGVLSRTGRFALMWGAATNMVAGGTDGRSHTYIRDLDSGELDVVSVTPGGVPCVTGSSSSAVASEDGRFVAFASTATDLVPGDASGALHLYLRDRLSGTTTRVTGGMHGSPGSLAPSSFAISRSGRFLAFASDSANLVPNDTNGVRDVFLYDHHDGTVRRISLAHDGQQLMQESSLPDLDANGRFATFVTSAPNVVLPVMPRTSALYRVELPGEGTLISGSVDLSGFTGPAPTPSVTFELVPVGGGGAITIDGVPLGPGGSFSFAAAGSGAFEVYAKASTFLRRKLQHPIQLGGGSVSGLEFVLINGDVDGSNRIDLDDFLILAAVYESQPLLDPRADLNGDGAVDLEDYIILAANYEVTGD